MRSKTFHGALGVAALLCASMAGSQTAPGGTATLSGRVTLLLPAKSKVDPDGSVVWIPGLRLAGTNPAATMASHEKRFEPRVVAVPAGSRVSFPNVDPIYHNAFSLSPGNSFDMGLYRKGASRETILKNPGVVRVYCNIHPEMAASVVVVDGNAFDVVQADGTYRITGIPPGQYEVHLWSDVAGEQTVTLTLEAGRNTDWSPQIDGTRYQRVDHVNKYGKAYPKAKNGADRY